MRYITDAKEAKQIDNISINEIGIPSLVLMERAALGVVEEIEKVYGELSANACVKRKTEDNFLNSQRCKKSAELKNVNSKILVVAGMGNNGADGVAAARMLEHDGIKTAIKLVGNIEHASEEMKKQLEIAKNLGISFVTDMKKNEYDIIVDAIFGIGLSREITGEYREIIEKINGSNSYIVSVDISSGVDATGGKILGTAVKADMTVTFGNLKRGMLLFPGAVYSGEIKVKDIGFPDKAVESVSPKAYTFEKNDLYCMLPQRKMRTNKGSYGKVLVIAGCEAMCGACYFSAAAAYRAGCGLVRVLTAKENMQILKTKLPEAIVGSYDEEFEDGIDFTPKKEVEEAIGWADVIVIGPGLGKSIKAKLLVKRILKVKDKTVVIDADGLNILAKFIENKTDFRSFFISMISPTSFAISLPLLIAIPISAAFRGGASFIPSPMKMTFEPSFFKEFIISNLPSGKTPAITLSISSSFATTSAVFSLSPVSITGIIPRSFISFILCFASSFMVSLRVI